MAWVDTLQWLIVLLAGLGAARLSLTAWRAWRGRPARTVAADPFGNRRLFLQRRRARWS